MPTDTVRLTVAQAIVTYLSRQYSVADGQRRRLVPAALGIFGHGNVAGLGQALDQLSDAMPFIQGRNEQALVHAATAYAKATRRHATLAVTASIGPGALNMVTGAGLATVNRLPVLLLPGDAYATRRQGPVLQQLQHPIEADTSVNDAFRPSGPLLRPHHPARAAADRPAAAMRVLTDPVDTGAVVSSLPQDIQSHAYDYPAEFFAERDWTIRRPLPDPGRGRDGGPVAGRRRAAADHRRRRGRSTPAPRRSWRRWRPRPGIPVAETFAGKGAVQQRAWWQVGRHRPGGHPGDQRPGPRGRPGPDRRLAADRLRHRVAFAVPEPGRAFRQHQRQPARCRAAGRHRDRRRRQARPGRARRGRRARRQHQPGGLAAAGPGPQQPVAGRARGRARTPTRRSTSRPCRISDIVTDTDAVLTQGQLIGLLQEHARAGDVIIAAAGGPPGDLQKVWDATEGRLAHLEFGFSCMGYEMPAASACGWRNPTPPSGSSRSSATAPS